MFYKKRTGPPMVSSVCEGSQILRIDPLAGSVSVAYII